LVFGGWRLYERLARVRNAYEGEAYMFSPMEETARADGKMTDEEWLAICRDIERRNREGETLRSGGVRALLLPGPPPDVERRRAEYYAAMRVKYERAARYPGLPVAPDLPEPR
jgi:hypothetical protein